MNTLALLTILTGLSLFHLGKKAQKFMPVKQVSIGRQSKTDMLIARRERVFRILNLMVQEQNPVKQSQARMIINNLDSRISYLLQYKSIN